MVKKAFTLLSLSVCTVCRDCDSFLTPSHGGARRDGRRNVAVWARSASSSPSSHSVRSAFLGNLTTLDLMGWDVLEPEEEGYRRLGLTVPDLKADDFRDLKVRVRFGFESQRPVVEFETPYALCFPPGTRARGCQELIQPQDQGNGTSAALSSWGLPCVQQGRCPFVTFTCSRGHTWKAEPGSPACFYCPICRTRTSQVRGQLSESSRSTTLEALMLQRRGLTPAGKKIRNLRARKMSREDGRPLQTLQEAAAAKGGKLLSETYTGTQTRYSFECEQGHQWQALAHNILHRGSWCPCCWEERRYKPPKLGLEEMRRLAESHGGTCLSEEYIGSKTKMLWQCAAGHTFWKAPNQVRRRTGPRRFFCSECARQERKAAKGMGQSSVNRRREPAREGGREWSAREGEWGERLSDGESAGSIVMGGGGASE